MDTQVIVAIMALASALLVSALAIFGNKQKYPAEYMDDVRGDLRDEREWKKDAITERDASNVALATALHLLGVVQSYARELETRLGIPHRRWTDDTNEPEA